MDPTRLPAPSTSSPASRGSRPPLSSSTASTATTARTRTVFAGSLTLGATAPRFTARVQAGAERYDNYKAGSFDSEDTRPLFASGQLRRADTIDDNFGFAFRAFPDPFNAPYVRTDDEVLNSQADGQFVNASGLVKLADRQTLRLRYQSRRMKDIGFPDFAAPYFFNATSLPKSDLDKVSARYEAQAITPWLANVSLTGVLPAHGTTAPQRSPGAVSGADASHVLPDRGDAAGHSVGHRAARLDAGLDCASRLRSGVEPPVDDRCDAVSRSQQRSADDVDDDVAGGAGGDGRSRAGGGRCCRRRWCLVRRRSPIRCAFPTRACATSRSSRRTSGGFGPTCRSLPDCAATSTRSSPRPRRATASRRSSPARRRRSIQSKLPNPNGASYARKALTGDIGLVANTGGRDQPVRARRPQLSPSESRGDAVCRAGNGRQPRAERHGEARDRSELRCRRQVPRRRSFWRRLLVRESVPATSSRRISSWPPTPRARSRRRPTTRDVRISGVELSADAPIAFRRGVLTLSAASALTRGTITEGVNPLDKSSLDGHAVRQHHAVPRSRSPLDSATTAAAGGWTTASAPKPRSRGWPRRCSIRRS